jgi:hypothetical protein
MLLQRVDIFGENGGTLLNQLYGLDLFLGNMFFDRNEFENISNALELSTNYAPLGTSIANGATRTLYIPLLQPFYTSKIHTSALKGQLLFRFYFNLQNMTTVSGGLIDCTDLSLVINGRQQPDFIQDKQRALYYDPIPLALTFTNVQRMSQSFTLATNNTYSFVLSGIKGICNVFAFTLRASALTASNVLTFVDILDYDVQAQDGSSMIGFYRRDDADTQLDYACCFNNLMRNNLNFGVVSFTTTPILDYSSGSNHGYCSFSSFEKLSFTTTSTITPGNYVLDIVAFVADEIRVKDGRITSTRA